MTTLAPGTAVAQVAAIPAGTNRTTINTRSGRAKARPTRTTVAACDQRAGRAVRTRTRAGATRGTA
jgi:hypothetical protein